MGWDVWRSHTTAVSLWLVIPMETISWIVSPAFNTASVATPIWVDHISFGSCSTHPGCGKNWVNSFCATEMILPYLAQIIALDDVVPWSNARMYFDMQLVFMFSPVGCLVSPGSKSKLLSLLYLNVFRLQLWPEQKKRSLSQLTGIWTNEVRIL